MIDLEHHNEYINVNSNRLRNPFKVVIVIDIEFIIFKSRNDNNSNIYMCLVDKSNRFCHIMNVNNIIKRENIKYNNYMRELNSMDIIDDLLIRFDYNNEYLI